MAQPGDLPRPEPGNRRTSTARAAYLIFLATPPADRDSELNTTKKFCETFKVSVPELYEFIGEPGFMDAVAAEVTHWKIKTAQVIASYLANACDASRKDQDFWGLAYLTIVGHPAADALRALDHPDSR